MSSPTRMPRLTSSLAARASSTFGRMPIASTTKSAGMVRPSASTTASARSVPSDFLGLAVGEEGNAAGIEIAMQQHAGRDIELPLHQRRHQMHQRDRHAAPLQSPRRFEPEKSAADHHRAPSRCAARDHRLDIGDIAEGTHIGQAEAGNRRRQGFRAGRQQ